MSHELEIINGEAMAFYVKDAAWHLRGDLLQEAPKNALKAITRISPYSYVETPLGYFLGDSSMPCTVAKGIVRTDGKEIAVVGPDYVLEQPQDRAPFLQSLIDSGLVSIDAGMMLREGRQMAIVCKIHTPTQEVVSGDPIAPYLTYLTSFDGSLSSICLDSFIRVVCANTQRMALKAETNAFRMRAKHTAGHKAAIAEIEQSVEGIIRQYNGLILDLRSLAKKPLQGDARSDYFKQVLFPKQPENKELSTRAQNILLTVDELLSQRREIECIPAIRDTAYEAYQTVTNYLTHELNTHTEENRFTSNLYGPANATNRRAFELAMRA